MSFSDFLELKLLDHVFGNVAYTAPSTLHVALSTTTPNDNGSNFTEPSGNGYSRVAVANNATNFPAASAGSKSNGTAITFPTATGSWGTVTHFGLYDSASAGNLIGWGALTTSKSIVNGDTAEFAIGALIITLD
jgi:hypothetical protein